MTTKGKILALASAAMLTSTVAIAEVSYTPSDLSDVTVFESYMGSNIVTMDGTILGTVSDVDIDENTADFIVKVAEDADLPRDTINVTAEQGTVAVNGGDIILLASNDEIQEQVQGSQRSDANLQVDLYKK